MKMRTLVVTAALAVLIAPAARAADVNFSAKAKAKGVQGDFVPAFRCASGVDQGECAGNLLVGYPAGNVTRSSTTAQDCKFEQGKFKVQAGKDGQAQLKGVTCAGGEPTTLCAHVKGYTTIANQELDSKGMTSAETCTSGGLPIAGSSNYSTANVGILSCSKGTCKGTLTAVTADPCPTVDKVTNIDRVEVFDGGEDYSYEALPGSGVFLGACCEAGVATPPGTCTGPAQKVLALPGQMIQTKD